ncbi:DeoR/GlpR family DNA-binding transcription regulator [Anaerolentibacter hominis]|uniref:DeoR/GlpR family DNA-binding transcription regulator n=1 Tax=Anaerolentibacter hominis TaxID=3079009 RepID=UPI0031B7F4C7
MIPYVRREQILSLIDNREVVYMEELAEKLNVSVSTVRRDLLLMAEEGQVVVLRGGAVRRLTENQDMPVIHKKKIQVDAKRRIAEKAASLVKDGEVIYLDSGTTTVEMFNYLQDKKVMVVTSAVPDCKKMAQYEQMKVIFLGGELIAGLESVVGSITEKLITSMYFDKAFLGCSGYGREIGICTYDTREARKKELVNKQAKEVFILADTSKENKKCFCKVFEWEDCKIINER